MLDGRKYIMVYYSANVRDSVERMKELVKALVVTLGIDNIKFDRIHWEVLTPHCRIKLVTYDDFRYGRLKGISADECFGFGSYRDEYVKKAGSEPYAGIILNYIKDVEGV